MDTFDVRDSFVSSRPSFLNARLDILHSDTENNDESGQIYTHASRTRFWQSLRNMFPESFLERVRQQSGLDAMP